jgi:hypothetical protein
VGVAVASSSSWDVVEAVELVASGDSEAVLDESLEVLPVRPVTVDVDVADGPAEDVADGLAEDDAAGVTETVGVGVGVGVDVATTAGTSPAAVTLSSSSCARRPINESVAASAAIAMTAATTQRALLPLPFSPFSPFSPFPFSPLSPPLAPEPVAGPSGLDTVTP